MEQLAKNSAQMLKHLFTFRTAKLQKPMQQCAKQKRVTTQWYATPPALI